MLSILNNAWLFLLLLPVILLIFAGTVAARISDNEFTLQIQLEGAAELEVEYGTEFNDPGALAFVSGTVFMRQPQRVDVSSSGYVDTSMIGTYSLSYTADFGDVSQTQTRTVYVVDTTAPVITWVSDPDTYTLPGKPYQEEGFAAYDAYDGDVTDQVVREEKGGIVYYSVKDSSGNLAQVTREIVYNDETAPVLTLLGAETVVVYVGSYYQDPGCSATDDGCEDIASRITVSGNVDTNRLGTYVLTYRVEDDFGNFYEAKRIVHVVNKPIAGKVIYLTFDDGPGSYTNRLLDILKKYDVKATFFLVQKSNISLANRMIAEGHSVGIHSVSHDYNKIYASEEAFFADLYGMQKIIRDTTGVTTYLMRFPGGSSNKVSSFNPGIMTRLVKLVEADGFRYFDWNVSSSDTSNLTSEEIAQNIIRGIKTTSKAVVLQHDIYERSVNAVEEVILWGLENGYSFAALDYASPSAHHGVNN